MNKNYPTLKNLLPLFFLLFSIAAFSQITSPQIFTTSGPFTVPPGVTTIKVEAWGGGAAGNDAANRGGGGGAFAGINAITVIPGATYTVTVGQGGTAPGGNGQASSFGTLVVAAGASGESGGTVTASTGTIKYAGGNGGTSSGNGGAGGGGSAGAGGVGGVGGNTSSNSDGAAGIAGVAGSGTPGVAGGQGGNGTSGTGSPGTPRGGGGGEGGKNGSNGTGGIGQVKISWITVTPSGPTTICSGANVNLTASASPSSPRGVLLAEGFNNTTNTWTTTNNSTGGTFGNAAWTLRPNHYQITAPKNPAWNYLLSFNSNDASQFYLSNSDSQGSGGITQTFLTSPVISTLGYSSLSLEFYHYYEHYTGSSAKVEVSTNGTDWAPIASYTTAIGSFNAFAYTTINLGAYLGVPSLQIRFNYQASYGYWWAIDNVTVSGTRTNYDYSWTASPSGTSGLPAGAGTPSTTNASITANPTATTIYTVTASTGDGLIGQSSTTVTVNTTAPPTLGEVKNLTCIQTTGSVVLSGLPATGTWTLYQNGTSIGTGTGTTKTIAGLAPGSYTFTVGVASCLSAASSNVLIKPLPLVATYNGTWTNGPPTIEQSIVFGANYTSIGNLEGCDCTVNSGVQVTVQSGHTLKITNAVKVNTAAGTSLTFQNTASLVQVNDDAVNTGVISYIRINSTTRETDYTYWSSPVAGQILSAVSPETPSGFFYSFNAVEDNWNYAPPSTVMGVGTGYIIRGPKIVGTPPPTPHQATFKGTPNNGKIELPGIIKDRSYLLGNPYPSALSANKFITDNSAVLDGTLYFWTHMTPIGDAVFNPGSGVYAYSSNDYATYNLTGGLATNPGSAASQSVSDKPTGEIAAGQAFFTSSRLDPTNNTIVFNNRMRLDVNDAIINNSQFFKVKNSTKKTNTIEKHRVWLNLTNTQGAFKQMLVGYITGATNDYDSSFDGPSYNGNEFIDFYSISDGEFLAIQGRALPFDENDFVALGYSSAIEGDFSISIDEVDGLLVGQNIYLEDKLNNTIHNLTKEAYTFETTIGTFDDRFVLRYTDKTLGVADLDQLEDQVIISKDKNELKIKSATETIKRVTIFDLLGKKVFDKEALDETEFRSSNVSLFKQTGIVKVTFATGQVISKKVAF